MILALEKKEIVFLKELKVILADWISNERIHLPLTQDKGELKKIKYAFENWTADGSYLSPLKENKDDYNFDKFQVVDLFMSIINRFLYLDLSKVDDIYSKKYNQQLINFFIDNFHPEKVIFFVAFIIHLVLEENLGLFFLRLEPTGQYCGNWAIAYNRDDALGKLLVKRIQLSHGREGIVGTYFNAYRAPLQDEYKPRIFRGDHMEGRQEKEDQPPTVLKKLVGASAAIIFLTALMKCARGAFRIWLSDDLGTQAMFSAAYLPGSIKFYGFCMQKPKDRPHSKSNYFPAYRNDLQRGLIEIYDRIEIFINFFLTFVKTQDSHILALANSKKRQKIWFILQIYFWLITQPYCVSPNELDKEIEHFREMKEDKDLNYVIKKCVEITKNENINIHRENINIYSEFEKAII
jgi:hypothetical protein